MKIHIRYKGQSQTLNGEELGIDRNSDEKEIREILSRFYELPPGSFGTQMVDRNPDGIVVRPPAVFG